MNTQARDLIVELLIRASDRSVTPADVTAETRLREDLELDSLAAVHLILDLEDKLGIRVDDEHIRALRTVGDIFAVAERQPHNVKTGSAA